MEARGHRFAFTDEDLGAPCRRWSIVEVGLFGSVVRDDFSAASDVDILVSFAPTARIGIFDLARLEKELATLLGRPVDVVTRRSLEDAPHPLRRDRILREVEMLRVA